MAKAKDRGWRWVVTRKDHACWNCRKLIPAKSRCLSDSSPDGTGHWTTKHICPNGSCYFQPTERAALLAPIRPKQLPLL